MGLAKRSMRVRKGAQIKSEHKAMSRSYEQMSACDDGHRVFGQSKDGKNDDGGNYDDG